jgi:hypothetical protein
MVNVMLVIVARVTISFISCDQECGPAFRPAVVALDTGDAWHPASQTFCRLAARLDEAVSPLIQ